MSRRQPRIPSEAEALRALAEDHPSDAADALADYDFHEGADELLPPAALAARWHTTANALAKQRENGIGPKFVVLNERRIAYRLCDVRLYEASRIAISTAQAQAVGLLVRRKRRAR